MSASSKVEMSVFTRAAHRTDLSRKPDSSAVLALPHSTNDASSIGSL